MSTKYKYALSEEGKIRCEKNEFFLQGTPGFKGYTEKIFRVLYVSEPKTLGEISQQVGIKPSAVNGVLSFNIAAGYILRIRL